MEFGLAGDYKCVYAEVGCYSGPILETFATVFKALSKLAKLKALDLKEVGALKGDLWEPLSMLQSLEHLEVVIFGSEVQTCQSITKMGKLS